MSLKDNWTNKTDNVDDVVAEDINIIAQAVISDEEQIENNSIRITTLETNMGNVATALDGIIAIQNNLLGVSE